MADETPQTHVAAVLRGAKDLKLQNVRTPHLKPHEISIAPRATGICGTDLHYYQNGKNGIYTIKEALTLGHEASGEVVAVGSAVAAFKIGDRVVVEPQVSCLTCPRCRLGRYNLCPSMRFNGSASADPPAQGSLQKVWNHPAALCYKLPETVSFAEGALVEPLSVALHSVRKACLQAGQTVLITGAGAVGLLCARIARISGASSITMVDVDPTRLQFAKQHQLANSTLLIPPSPLAEESSASFASRIAGEVRSVHGGEPDAALECTGAEACMNLCINSAAPGSKIIMVGMGAPRQEIDVGVALVREIEILGVWRYTNTFQPAIDLIAAGMVDVKSMVTHLFDMERVIEALEFALSKPKDLVKCVITST